MRQFRTGSKLFFLVLILLFCSIQLVHASYIVNPGFETSESTNNGWPSSYGDWSGDDSHIVGAENGIDPYGINMLKFDFSALTGGATSMGSSQVVQLVDVSAFSDAIDAGLATASASAWFNRVAGDSQTDTDFAVLIIACSGSPFQSPSIMAGQSWLSHTMGTISTDGALGTWEFGSIDTIIPAGTDFIAVELRAIENIFNDTSGTEFDGHYADTVTLNVSIVPVPATILLLGSGLIGLLGLRRKSRSIASDTT